MSVVNQIVVALEFVETHLKEDIQVSDMASASGYSLYHFCRTFSKMVHISPFEYLMRRRLSLAAKTVIQTRLKIIDIAFMYRFNSPEVFSRVFKRTFGIQPLQARKQKYLDPFKLLPAVSNSHLAYFEQVLNSFSSELIEIKNEVNLIGLSQNITQNKNVCFTKFLKDTVNYLKPVSDSNCDMWGKLNWDPLRKQYQNFIGVPYLPQSVGNQLVNENISIGKYRQFSHQGSLDLIHDSFVWLYLTGKVDGENNCLYLWYKISGGENIDLFV